MQIHLQLFNRLSNPRLKKVPENEPDYSNDAPSAALRGPNPRAPHVNSDCQLEFSR
jgi:hypothetical protein